MHLPNLDEAKKRTSKNNIYKNLTENYPKAYVGKKYFLRTYGCQMNVHDSEAIRGYLEMLGMENTTVIVLNTCAIRENARDKVIGFLGKCKYLKKNHPDIKIVIAGCMSEQPDVIDDIMKNHKYVDIVVGTHNLDDLPKLLLKDLILERLEYFKAFFEQKKIELKSDLNQKSTLFASKIEISKLFDNLLSNAIKYNKKGGKIIIELKENSLKISDNGCGIAKENLKNIFERYTRFNTDQGGFGIGLSLVKRICDENKITISCTSNENQGSTFTLEW